MHNKENPVTRQRKIHFEDDELWNKLPESVRESCRSLWKELLASVVKKNERRQHERDQREAVHGCVSKLGIGFDLVPGHGIDALAERHEHVFLPPYNPLRHPRGAAGVEHVVIVR